jgi:hypothetical protein
LTPGTDLVRVVARVCREQPPYIIVSAAAEAAWAEKDPTGWSRVREWLAARRGRIVRVPTGGTGGDVKRDTSG